MLNLVFRRKVIFIPQIRDDQIVHITEIIVLMYSLMFFNGLKHEVLVILNCLFGYISGIILNFINL